MFKTSFISGLAVICLCAPLGAQQTQTGPTAQPTSSVYDRMRRVSPQQPGAQSEPQTSQQFPTPAQQFPPDQHAPAMPGRRPPISFPHPPAPEQQSPQAPAHIVTPPQQQPPQEPLGAALRPANPPRISYAGGELTVMADNSSLIDILAGIQRITGARLEGSHPDPERVFGSFGPGTPRQVVNSLLSGSRYDFILVSALDDPASLQKIVLSPHGSVAGNNTFAANQQAQRQNYQPPPSDDDDNEGIVTQQVLPEPQQNEAITPSETVQPQQSGQQQQQQVKTPEQLLQELQRLRQQQQQQPQQATNPR